MTDTLSPVLAEVTRGPFVESVHRGAAVVCTPAGEVVAAWGDPSRTILPRSACKMLQALPLVESGAADAARLGEDHLALACASHQGGAMHTDRVRGWLAALGLDEPALRCGPQPPADAAAAHVLAHGRHAPDQTHNNCSGKHAGFLTLNARLGGGAEYIDPDHPVQRAVRAAFYEATGDDPDLGHAIDGCSAPNWASTLQGLATAMARMARPAEGFGAGVRARAAERLVAAMIGHPELVAGEGRVCTGLMRASGGRAAVKTGAEGVFCAILPEAGVGVALKIDDGATRGAEAAMAALLVRLGALDAGHPEAAARADAPIRNRRDTLTGTVRAAPGLAG